LRAFNAKFARLRVFADREFFIFRNFATGIFLPFLAPAAFRSRPRREGLIRMRFLAAKAERPRPEPACGRTLASHTVRARRVA
jgi:hypothetical protein